MGTGNDQDKRVDDQLPLENEPHTLSNISPNQSGDNPSDDIDEALAWLEQLAAKQGISVDELTSRHPEALELSFPELGLAQSDELPEWLKEEPPARRLREFPSSAGETAAIDDIPDWLISESPSSLKPPQGKESSDLSTELDSRLDWLAEMGKKDELAEMPTVRWRPEDAGLADSGIPPSADFNVPEDRETAGQIPSPDMADLRSNGPEDLDEAMAWLEELATSQETPLQELPSVADRILASRLMAESGMELDEPSSEEPLFASTFSDEAFTEPEARPIEVANFPDNLDDAMDYLDKLASIRQQSASPVSESPVVEEPATLAELNLEAEFGNEAEDNDNLDAVLPVAEVPVEDEGYETDPAVAVDEEVEAADEVHRFLAEMLASETDEALALETDEPLASETDEILALETDEILALETDEVVATETGEMLPLETDELPVAEADEVLAVEVSGEGESDGIVLDEPDVASEIVVEGSEQDEREAAVIDEVEEDGLVEVEAELEIEDEAFVVEDEPEDLPGFTFTIDRLEVALSELDQLSLPPGVTLQTLNEEFAAADAAVSNGNGLYHDLNSTLLWLEQSLDPAADEPTTTESAEPPEPARETDELLLSVADLDDDLVAELTADMPENPDEALEWLLGLADEVESDMAAEDGADDELVDIAAEQSPGPAARNVRIYDMPEPLSLEESLVGDQAEEVAEEEPGETSHDWTAPPVFSTEELPEMPDDPDEAIAWIERLAALEAQESAITVEQPFADEFGEDVDFAEVEDEVFNEIAQSEEGEADYSGYEVESALIVEGAEEADEATADGVDEAPISVEQTDSPVAQPRQAARRPHERWLDQLQPPSWAKK